MGKDELDPTYKPGIVIQHGIIPRDSLALEFAREIAAETGTTIIVTDLSATPIEIEEGLPHSIEIDPVITTNN